MAQLYPEKWIDRRKNREAERQFYNYCRDLDPEIIVIHDLEWYGERPKGYPYYQDDFFIIHPKHGILLVEVKGGVKLTYKDRQWKMKPHIGKDIEYSRSPISQAHEAARAFIRDIWDQHSDDIPECIKNSVCHAVCFPNIDAEEIDGKTKKAFGVNRALIIDRKKLWSLQETIEEIFLFWENKGHLKGFKEWTDNFVDILKGLLVPDFEWEPYLRVVLEHEDTVIQKLSDEQSQVWLKAFAMEQFAVPGCAGSGKTVLALMLAHLWSKEHTVLVCCYNIALAYWLKRKIGNLNGVKILTIHQLWNDLLPDEQGKMPDEFPERIKDKIHAIRKTARYEAVIVDEAQDFHYDWWLLIDKKRNDNSRFAVFYDDNQQVYRNAGKFPWDLPKTPLTINFRTTCLIHEQITYFYRGPYPPSPAPGAPVGEKVSFTPCGNFNDMLEECNAILKNLKTGGIKYADIVIILPRADKDKLEILIAYLNAFPINSNETVEDTILLTSIRKFKGLERKVVILIGVDAANIPHDQSSEVLYVGYSRARLRLYVLYNSELPKHYVVAEEGRRAPVNEALILQGLNNQQVLAVQAPLGVSIIRAGAGSGKTQVLTRRIAHLIDAYSVESKSIVAVTFTNKAARELRRRLQDLLLQQARDITVGTFHSICVQILRREIPHLPNETWQGRDSQFQIVNTYEYFPAAYDSDIYAPWIEEQKTEGRTPRSVIFKSNIPESRHSEYVSVLILYNRLLESKNAFDFNDLLSATVDLLREYPEILSRLQRKWKHILVDEFQDTNQVQFDLVDLLYRLSEDPYRSLTVVGDAQQSIYSWRGAKYQLFRDIDQYYPDTQLYELTTNYRSVPPILDVAHAIATEERLGVPPLYLNAHRDKDNVTLSPIITETVIEEIGIVADIIIDFVESRQYKWRDIVILLRSPRSIEGKHTINIIQNIFTQRGIPYHTLHIESLYNNIFVKVMNLCLKIIDDPHNDDIFGDWICTPLFNDIDRATVNVLTQERTRLRYRSIWDLLLSQSKNSLFPLKTEENLRNFLESLPGIGPLRAGRIYQVFEIANQIIPLRPQLLSGDAALIEDALIIMDSRPGISIKLRNIPIPKKKRPSEEDDEDLEEPDKGYGALAVWRNLIRDGLASHQDIPEAIDLIYLSSNEQDAASTDDNRVRVQTIHSAKGLEFPIVFVLGFEEGQFPFRKAITIEELREEARICYVALTRARDHLIVSMTKYRLEKIATIKPRGRQRGANPLTIRREEAKPSQFLPSILSIMEIYQEIASKKTNVIRMYSNYITVKMIESLNSIVNQNIGEDIAIYLEGADEMEIHQVYSLGNIGMEGKEDIISLSEYLGCNIIEE